MSESQANVMIDELIMTLNQLIEHRDLGSFIKDPKLLIEGLNDLKKMIEMVNIKMSIVEQIKLLITNKSRNNGYNENHMLHTVITGFPGSGKTSVARILAKIWISLDMIKMPLKKPDDKNYIETLEKAVIAYDYKINNMNNGIEKQIELMNKIKTGINNIKNHGNKNYYKLLTQVRDARFNLDKMLTVPIIVEKEEELKFTVASRDTLIAGYLGQSAIKTKAVLEKAAGGVLFIDEAYSLYTSERDAYGEECLNVINEFMSLRPDEIIIIFAGYKDLLLNSIFKVQPGLQRRCMWFFDIPKYSQDALARIFTNQLEHYGWVLDKEMNINHIFKKYNNVLKTPGDTEKLVFQSKIAYAEDYFNYTLEDKSHNSMITQRMVLKAIEKMIRNAPNIKEDSIPMHMYT